MGGPPQNTSSPPGTMKLHMAPPFSGLAWSVVRRGHVQWDRGGSETPNVSILLKGNLLRRVQMDEQW